MKLSISNIAWNSDYDDAMYDFMHNLGYKGLEIAPSRIFGDNPYQKVREAQSWSINLKQKYGLSISSIQSILFNITQNIFGSEDDRKFLISYIKKSIDFASSLNCKNLVFGCPKNRILQNEFDKAKASVFFKELGDYAASKATILSIEANPTIYNTNFVNFTSEAFDLAREVSSEGFKVNFDLGTTIANKEDLKLLEDNSTLIHHVHISEPFLNPIEKRRIHKELFSLLNTIHYNNFVSIEMKNCNNLPLVQECMKYIKELSINNYE